MVGLVVSVGQLLSVPALGLRPQRARCRGDRVRRFSSSSSNRRGRALWARWVSVVDLWADKRAWEGWGWGRWTNGGRPPRRSSRISALEPDGPRGCRLGLTIAFPTWAAR